MASYNTNQYIDTLTVNTIFTKGANNTNIPAFRVLTTDGNGGTIWMSLSSLQYGAAYHTIQTSVGKYTADQATNATFSLLDGPNAGLINDPTASNTAYLYAKAFGQFDISGGNSIRSYDPITNTVNSNILFVGTGGINIKGDPQTNTMFFDGRELPFVSTLPYSFNQAVVYSNVPQNTLIASTNKSIILQAQSASSILGFVGEDLVVIDTNYASNQIQIKLSTLTQSNVSTLFTHDRIIFSTFVNRVELSTLSTTYGELLSFTNFQNGISTMSTNIDYKINYNSTIIGDVNVYSRGISTVWREFVRENFITGINNTSNLVSTTASLTVSISTVQSQVITNVNTLTASTIISPYLIASTLVTSKGNEVIPIPTPTLAIKPLYVKYYPLYSSFYNVFNDTLAFGSPVTPPIYPTLIDLTTGNAAISTVSTISGTLFSSMYTLKGTFVFYPNDQIHNFNVEWVGNLTMNINNKECLSTPIAYPNANTFGSHSFTSNMFNYPITIVNFTYSKLNPADYIKFSNFTDYVDADETFAVAPIYPAYGYDTTQAPLYSETISKFPAYFSSPSNLVGSPYLALSSYVMIASTFYTTGANTTFPVTASGYTSIEFLESATQIQKYGVREDLSNGPSQYYSNNKVSASNAFGYDFNTQLPNSPYVMQLMYAHQDTNEILTISSLYKTVNTFTYTPAVYISSLLYLSNISSYSAEIYNLHVSTINGAVFSADNTSSLSCMYNGVNLITSSIEANLGLFSSTLIDNGGYITASTTYAGVVEIANSLSVNVTKYSTNMFDYGVFSSYTGLGRISGESTLSTNYAGVRELICSMSTNINKFSSVNYNYGVLSSYTGLGYISGESTLSTNYAGIRELTCSLSTSVNRFSANQFNYGVLSSYTGLGLVSGESTLSTNYAGIRELTCSLSTSVNRFSANQFNYGVLSSYTGLGLISGESTLSTNYAAIRELTCSLSTNITRFSATQFNLGALGIVSSESTLSTNYAGVRELICSLSTNVTLFSANQFNFGSLSSYTGLGRISGESTLSTNYAGVRVLTCSLSTNVTRFSSTQFNFGSLSSYTGLGRISGESTLSTNYAGVRVLTCSLSTNVNRFSTNQFNYGLLSSYVGASFGRINGESTLSTNYAGIRELTCSISTNIFKFSTNFNLGALSSYTGLGRVSGESTLSTTYAGVKDVINSISANIVRFSTGLQNLAITNTELFMSTVYTSSIFYSGVRQPFIQYGIALNLPVATPTIPTVVLPRPYQGSNYSIQLTYSNTTSAQLQVSTFVYATSVRSNSFSIIGTLGKNVYWTTFGDIF